MPLPLATTRRLRALAATLAFATVGCAESLSPEAAYQRALAAAEDWAAANESAWSVNTAGNETLRRPTSSQGCASDVPVERFPLEARAGGAGVTLYFDCSLGASSSAAALQAAFRYAVVEELPHGVRVSGWRFQILTPSSIVTSGVTFEDVGLGRVRVGMETPLYGIYGQSQRDACVPPADSAMPPECFVFREHRIQLTLQLTVPFDGATFP